MIPCLSCKQQFPILNNGLCPTCSRFIELRERFIKRVRATAHQLLRWCDDYGQVQKGY